MTPAEAVEQALMLDTVGNVGAIYFETCKLRDQWKQAADEIESHLLAVMDGLGTEHFMIDGTAYFVRERSTSRSGWDHDALWREVRRAALTNRNLDTSTGEVQTEIEALAEAFRECVQVGGWKTTGLRRYGISADEYSTPRKTERVKAVEAE